MDTRKRTHGFTLHLDNWPCCFLLPQPPPAVSVPAGFCLFMRLLDVEAEEKRNAIECIKRWTEFPDFKKGSSKNLTAVLLFGQQEPPMLVAKRLKCLAVNTEKSPKFLPLQTRKKCFVSLKTSVNWPWSCGRGCSLVTKCSPLSHLQVDPNMESMCFQTYPKLKMALTVELVSRLQDGSQTDKWHHDDSVQLYVQSMIVLCRMTFPVSHERHSMNKTVDEVCFCSKAGTIFHLLNC